MKALFKGVLRLLCTHLRTPQQIRLTNGKWVQFDPRDWDPDMDVEVDVARGVGDRLVAQEAVHDHLALVAGQPLERPGELLVRQRLVQRLLGRGVVHVVAHVERDAVLLRQRAHVVDQVVVGDAVQPRREGRAAELVRAQLL